MYFKPETLNVKAGETVRFVVKTKGNCCTNSISVRRICTPIIAREMAMMMEHGMLTPTGINPERMNMDHGQMGMGSMKHDDPNSVLVEPGKTMELV